MFDIHISLVMVVSRFGHFSEHLDHKLTEEGSGLKNPEVFDTHIHIVKNMS